MASQTASDIAALFAFHFVGLPAEDVPYSTPERQGTRRLGELQAILRGSPESAAGVGALPDEVKPAIERELGKPSGGNWRRCTVGELETIQRLLPRYRTLEEMAAGIETLDDLLEYSQAQALWRENLPAKLAHCGETLEIAWLISENIGDLALMHALKLQDFPPAESPVFQQVMSNIPGINTWEGLLPSLLDSYEQSDGVEPLPACAEPELDEIATILLAQLHMFKDHSDIRSMDDLRTLVDLHLGWREVGWSRLPLCFGSFEAFLRASWFFSDNTVHAALELAGVPPEGNPYPEQIALNRAHIESWYAIVDGVVAPPSAMATATAPEA